MTFRWTWYRKLSSRGLALRTNPRRPKEAPGSWTGSWPARLSGVGLGWRLSQTSSPDLQYVGWAHQPAAKVTLDWDAGMAGQESRWAAAQQRQDLDAMWEIWAQAASVILGHPATGRGRLSLTTKQVTSPPCRTEQTAALQQEHQVASLLWRQQITVFEWPPFLGQYPATQEGGRTIIQTYLRQRRTARAREGVEQWKTHVRETWKFSKKKIFSGSRARRHRGV